MPIRQWFLSVLILFTHSIAIAGQQQTAPATPELSLQKLDGQSANLAEHIGKGKWTLVVFWATDCGICKMQQPEYSDFHKRHKDKDAEVIGIAIDGTDNMTLIKSYLQQNPMAYPTLVGNKPDIREKYHQATQETFRGTPTYWLFNPEGKLIGNQPGMLPAKSVEDYIARQGE